MKVEVLYFDGCPNHEALLPRLRRLMATARIGVPVELRRIASVDQAERERFLGSPTLRIDGRDIDPTADERIDYGLKCRLYAHEGGVRGAIPDELIESALLPSSSGSAPSPGSSHNPGMAARDVEILREAWKRFSEGDLSAVEQTLDPHVRWYGAGDPGGEGGCNNRDEALTFIRRALAEGTTAELLDIHDSGERLVLTLQRNKRPDEDAHPEPHGEVVTLRDGKVTEMVVFPNVDEAFAAVGQPRS